MCFFSPFVTLKPVWPRPHSFKPWSGHIGLNLALPRWPMGSPTCLNGLWCCYRHQNGSTPRYASGFCKTNHNFRELCSSFPGCIKGLSCVIRGVLRKLCFHINACCYYFSFRCRRPTWPKAGRTASNSMFLQRCTRPELHKCAAFLLLSPLLYRKSIRCVCSTKVFYVLKMHVYRTHEWVWV